MRRLLAPALAAALLPLFTPASAGAAVVCGVTGSLLDATGQAVPGVNLSFMNDNGYGSATTGSDGGFAFSTVCGTATLAITWMAPPRPGLPTDVDIRGTVSVTDGKRFDLRLPAFVDVTVKVTDAGGTPQVNAPVYQTNQQNEFEANDASVLAGAGAFTVREFLPMWRTDAAGRVHFLTFPDSDMALTAEAPTGSTLQPTDFVLNASATVSKTVVLPVTPPGTPLFGVVRDSAGRGVPGAYVYRSGVSRGVYANAAGEFRTYGPAGAATIGVNEDPNDYPAVAKTPDVPSQYRIADIPVTPGGAPVNITLPPVAHIKLTILRYDGTPVSSAGMHFKAGDCWCSSNTVIYSDPAVVLAGTAARRIEQSVSYAYSDVEGGISFNVFRSSTPLTDVRIEKSSDELLDLPPIDLRSDQNLTIRLPKPPEKYQVTGTLLDADGKPVGGAQIRATENSTRVDQNGHFALPVNEGANSVLEIHRSRGQKTAHDPSQDTVPDIFFLDVPIRVDGPTSLTLTLPRALHLTLRATDPDTRQPLKNAYLRTDDAFMINLTVPVRGASGVASGRQQLTGPPTNADGVAVYTTWPFVKAQPIAASAQKGSVYLSSLIHDLDMSGDKTLNIRLGTSAAPTTYRPPGPVTDVSAVATSPGAEVNSATPALTASLHWTAPRKSGGMPISGYRVTAHPGGRSIVVGKKATSALVGGLAPGTKYSFTVQAMNKIGRAKSVTTRLDLAAPHVTVDGKLRHGTARMSWTGIDDASGIANYDVRLRTAKTTKAFPHWTRVASKTTATRERFTLAPGMTSCVSVRARDKAGHLGPWSAPACVSRPA